MNRFNNKSKEDLYNLLDRFVVLSTTLFGIGKISKAPGTLGSIATVVLLYLTNIIFPDITTSLSFIVFIICCFSYGVYSSTKAEKKYGHDASVIIIDEFVGQLVVFAMLSDLQIWHLVVGLILFRFFDITKPLGIARMQSLASGWGIMIDDVLAGIYSFLLLNLLDYLLKTG